MSRVVCLSLCFCLWGCAPTACNEEATRSLEREVEVLIREAGPAAREAERRLVARGLSAVAILETGLYQADSSGRQRIIKTLVKIGHKDVQSILAHLARRDPDGEVRQQAEMALNRLTASSGPAAIP